MNRKARSFALILFLLFAGACGTQPTQGEIPTPVFIPVIVTVGIPFPVTVTPSDVLPVDPLGGGAEQVSVTEVLLSENIEEEGSVWFVFEDGGVPLWVIQNVDSPSLSGTSLQCSITGGEPYSGAHCYREFDPVEGANSFKLDMSFQFTPVTTCNNEGGDSVVQAIEFSMSRWENSLRHEFAVQWQNVGEGAPQWRYWDASQGEGTQWVPISSSIKHCLESDQWHTLALEGDIVDGQAHYKSFTIDNSTQQLDITVPPAPAETEIEYLAVAVQVNGNSVQAPYDLFIDNVNFAVEKNVDCSLNNHAAFTYPYVQSEVAEKNGKKVFVYKVEKNTKISWEPACLMDLQYYSNGSVIFERKDAKSGFYDLSASEIPTAEDIEVKIWIPGTETSFSSWVSVIPDQ